MEFIQNIDLWLFYLINVKLANPVTNWFMPFVTNLNNWLPVYAVFAILLLWKGGKKGRLAVVTIIITIIISDQLSSSILKELIGRIRPCHVLSDLNILVPCGAGKSFPSSHAVNNFAVAGILTYYYTKYKWYFYSIASIVAISRVFVGVHYPFDVIGGACIGFMISFVIIKIITRLAFVQNILKS